MPQNNNPNPAPLAEAERLIRAGRALLAWAGEGTRHGNYAEAERCFHRALDILRESVGDGHPQLALVWDRLAVLYEELGDSEEAETCYLRSLATQQAAGWESSVYQERTLLRLAQLYGRMAKHELQSAVLHCIPPTDAAGVGVVPTTRSAASTRQRGQSRWRERSA